MMTWCHECTGHDMMHECTGHDAFSAFVPCRGELEVAQTADVNAGLLHAQARCMWPQHFMPQTVVPLFVTNQAWHTVFSLCTPLLQRAEETSAPTPPGPPRMRGVPRSSSRLAALPLLVLLLASLTAAQDPACPAR